MIWCCLSDAVLKLAYGQLKFTQIADSQGYAVAEAFLQVGSSNDDGSTKQLDLAIKLAEKEFDRKAKRGRAEYGSGGGYGRGGGRGGRGGFAGGRHGSGAAAETGAAAGAEGGTHCKFDQLCSVNLFRLYRACVKLSLVMFV